MKIIKGALAIGLLLGTVSPFEMNAEQNLIDLQVKKADSEKAKLAHRKYQHAIVDFYNALPRNRDWKKDTGYPEWKDDYKYYKELRTLGEDYKACYQAWNAKAKLNPEYVDDASFNAYYNEIRDASSKRNATIKAEEEAKKKAEEEEKKKAEEEAKKKAAEEKPEENPEGELILEGEEEPKKKEHEKGEIDVFPELDNLRNAGIAFENKIQLALQNLIKGELQGAEFFYDDQQQYIDNVCSKGKYGGKTVADAYKDYVKKNNVPVQEFLDAQKAVRDEKKKIVEMFKTKDGIKDFYEDPNFYMVYARAIAKYEGFKEREFYEKKLVDFKGTKYEQFVKKAVEYMKQMKESDRLAFNKQFKALLTAAKTWAKAGKDLDDGLLKLHTVLEKAHVRRDLLHISYLHMDVITKRQQLQSVYSALTKLNGREENAIKEATKYQSAKKEAEQTNAIFWVLLSLALVGTVGGVAVCKNKKKFCFAEKDQIEEGGESDKTLFKKEVKSKKAHKKLAKEKLMPAFNVVEQA